MKTNELCIGDWVQVRILTLQDEERLTPPMRVCSIDDTWVCTMIDPEQGDPFDDNIEDIRPIPLTANILMANGWEAVGARRFKLENEDDNMCTTIDAEVWNDGTIYIEVFVLKHSYRQPVPYVHTLQHIMRRVGIEKEIKL